MSEITLFFDGPYSYISSEFARNLYDCPISKGKGIYLWTVPVNGIEYIHYVGQTGRSFGIRFKEHFRDQISGLYNIYDPLKLQQGIIHKLWNGLSFKGSSNRDIEEYLLKWNELVSYSKEYLKFSHLFFAPCDEDKRIRIRIESAIAVYLRSQSGIVANVFEPGVVYRPKLPEETPITCRITSSISFVCLPETLAV